MTGRFRTADRTPDQGEARAGDELLAAAHQLLTTYCALPSPEAADAVVLWCAATHALPVLPAAPRLSVTSAVKRCGKCRLLDLVNGLSYDPLPTMNATTAAVFRSLDADHPPTLIFDEVDTIFGSKRVAENNEDLRGLLNSGFQRGQGALRCVGPQQVPTLFATFAMAALAGIGGLPDTILDRSVCVRMRRRKAGESVRPSRERRDRPQLESVCNQLTAWLDQPAVRARLELAEPVTDLEDRAADVWEPLLMIADEAGGNGQPVPAPPARNSPRMPPTTSTTSPSRFDSCTTCWTCSAGFRENSAHRGAPPTPQADRRGAMGRDGPQRPQARPPAAGVRG